MTLKVADLRPCPNCTSKLQPVSLCATCGSVSVRPDLKAVDRRIECTECRASNPTVFVCEKCNSRFLFEEVSAPVGSKLACALCGTFVETDAKECPACGATFAEETLRQVPPKPSRPKRRVWGEYSDADLRDIAKIPGVGREKAEALCHAGLNALWKIKRATEADLARVPGIGPRGARTVKDSLRFILLLPRRKTKEEVLEEEYACPLCGTVTSLFAPECLDCGARFDEEELEEELRTEVEREVDKGLLAFYDVHLEESPMDADLWYARALLLFEMGKFEEALRSIDSARQLEPESRRAMLVRSRVLAALLEFSQAADSLKGALSGLRGEGEARIAAAEEEAKAATAALEALSSLQDRECPMCGEWVLPDAQVCPACGHRLEKEARPEAAPEADLESPPPEAPSGFASLEELERLVGTPESEAPPVPEADLESPPPAAPSRFAALEELERLAEPPESEAPPVPEAETKAPARRTPSTRPRKPRRRSSASPVFRFLEIASVFAAVLFLMFLPWVGATATAPAADAATYRRVFAYAFVGAAALLAALVIPLILEWQRAEHEALREGLDRGGDAGSGPDVAVLLRHALIPGFSVSLLLAAMGWGVHASSWMNGRQVPLGAAMYAFALFGLPVAAALVAVLLVRLYRFPSPFSAPRPGAPQSL